MPAADIGLSAVVNVDSSRALRDVTDFARKADRLLTLPLGRMSNAASEFDKSLAAANARVIAFGASAGIIFGVQRAFEAMLTSAIKVEKSLKDIEVVMKDQFSTDFGARLFDVARKTGASFDVAAKAATEFSRQGLDVEKTLLRTRDALALTRLTGMDAAEAVDALTASVNAFANTGITTTQILNKMAQVDQAFAVSSEDLAEAMKRVGSSAQDVGVDINSLLGLITSVKEITAASGSVIGNSLKTLFQRIRNPDTLEFLQSLNVSIFDNNKQIKDADDLLLDLAKRYKTLDPLLQNQVVQMAAGIYQADRFRAIMADLGEENSRYARARHEATAADNEALDRLLELNTTLADQVNSIKVTATELGSYFGKLVFDEPVRDIATAFDEVRQAIQGLSDSAGGVATLHVLESTLKGLGSFISGPGIAVVGTLIGKLFYDALKFAKEAFSAFLNINNTIGKQAELQRATNAIISSQPALLQDIITKRVSALDIESRTLQVMQGQYSIAQAMARVAVPASKGMVEKGYNLQTFYPTSGKGGRPNFSPIADAMRREMQSGIPLSQIRVSTHPDLKSPDNPRGVGIYNLLDEPQGLSQGIARARAQGLDPKKHGIPNFADRSPYTFTEPVPSSYNSLLDQQRKQVFDEIRTGKLVVKSQEDLVGIAKKLGESLKGDEKTVRRLTKSFTYAYNIAEANRKGTIPTALQVANQKYPVPPDTSVSGLPFFYNSKRKLLVGGSKHNISPNPLMDQLNAPTPKLLVGGSKFTLPNAQQFQAERQQFLQTLKEINTVGKQSAYQQQVLAFGAGFKGPQNLTQSLKPLSDLNKIIGDIVPGHVNAPNQGIRQGIDQNQFANVGLPPKTPGSYTGNYIGTSSRVPLLEIERQNQEAERRAIIERELRERRNNETRMNSYRRALQNTSLGAGYSNSNRSSLNPNFNLSELNGGFFPSRTPEGFVLKNRLENRLPKPSFRQRLGGRISRIAGNSGTPLALGIGASIVSQSIADFYGDDQTEEGIRRRNLALGAGDTASTGLTGAFLGGQIGGAKGALIGGLGGSVIGLGLGYLRFRKERENKAIQQIEKQALTGQGPTITQRLENQKLADYNTFQLDLIGAEDLLSNRRRERGRQALRVTDPLERRKIDQTQFLARSSFESELFAQDTEKQLLEAINRRREAQTTANLDASIARQKVRSDSATALTSTLLPQIQQLRQGGLGSFATNQNFTKDFFGALDQLERISNGLSLPEGERGALTAEQAFNEFQKARDIITKNNTSLDQDARRGLESRLRDMEDSLSQAALSTEEINVNLERQNYLTEEEFKTAEAIYNLTRKRNEVEINALLGRRVDNPATPRDLFQNFKADANTLQRERIRVAQAASLETQRQLLAFDAQNSPNNERLDFTQRRDNLYLPDFLQGIQQTRNDTQSAINQAIQSRDRANLENRRGVVENLTSFGQSELDQLASVSTNANKEFLNILKNNLDQVNRIAQGVDGGSLSIENARSEFAQLRQSILQDFSQNPNAFESDFASNLLKSFDTLDAQLFESAKTGEKINAETDKELQLIRARLASEEELFRLNRGAVQRARLAQRSTFSDTYATDMLRIRNENILNGTNNFKEDSISSFVDPLRYDVQDFYRDINEGAFEVGANLKTSFTDAFKEFARGTQSAEEALRSFALNVVNKIFDRVIDTSFNMFAGAVVNGASALAGSFTGRGYAKGGVVKRYAGGGRVLGGSGYKDDVPALLTEGEFVVRKQAVNKYGPGLLSGLNEGSVNFLGENTFEYDQVPRPTSGRLKVSPSLSNFALSDENNPQNQRRMDRESELYQYIKDFQDYEEAKRIALHNFEVQKQQRRIGAYISAATAIAGAGIQQGVQAYQTSSANMARLETSAANGDARAAQSLATINARQGNFGAASQYQRQADLLRSGSYNSAVNVMNRTYANGGLVQKFAAGGPIGQDNVPALLMGGEFVMNRNAVNKHGIDFFNRLNSGRIGKYAVGGPVGNFSVGSEITSSGSNNDKLHDTILKLIASTDLLRETIDKKETNNVAGRSATNNANEVNQPILNVYTTVNINSTGGDVKSSSNSGNGESTSSNNSNRETNEKVAQQLEGAIVGVMVKNLRPGGILHQAINQR